MPMNGGQLWHCTNPACRGEVLVEPACTLQGRANATCACGATMKRKYVPPTLSYLEFLREEQTVLAPGKVREE